MVAILDLPVFPSICIHIVYNASRQISTTSDCHCQEISRTISLFLKDLALFNDSYVLKITNHPLLQEVSRDSFESYHRN